MTVSEIEKKSLNSVSWIIGLVLVFLGMGGIMAANGQGSPDVAVSLFVVSFVVFGLGAVFTFKGGDFGALFLEKRRAKALDIVDETTEETLIENRRGIVWVWVVALTTWAIMAVAYFSLSMLVYMVLDSVEDMYVFGEQEMGIITLTKNVTGWFLIIMTIGIIGWALINSARREDQTYPI